MLVWSGHPCPLLLTLVLTSPTATIEGGACTLLVTQAALAIRKRGGTIVNLLPPNATVEALEILPTAGLL
jgi:hypothetical protein